MIFDKKPHTSFVVEIYYPSGTAGILATTVKEKKDTLTVLLFFREHCVAMDFNLKSQDYIKSPHYYVRDINGSKFVGELGAYSQSVYPPKLEAYCFVSIIVGGFIPSTIVFIFNCNKSVIILEKILLKCKIFIY